MASVVVVWLTKKGKRQTVVLLVLYLMVGIHGDEICVGRHEGGRVVEIGVLGIVEIYVAKGVRNKLIG